MFSGSYHSDDVVFLLKQITIPAISIEEKERAIQVEKKHYSQLLTIEKAPQKAYMELFYATLELNGDKFINDVWNLAQIILKNYSACDEITLVSLARAGTPIGVLLKPILKGLTNKKINHYSVSIIRDFGIDFNAMNYILNSHCDKSLCFIDAWTGKGVIGQELKKSIQQYNQIKKTAIPDSLYVVTDIAGTADFAASYEDYLLPNAVLNSTVSGLVSRTVLNSDYIQPDDFHGCVFYDYLKEHDVSEFFVKQFINKMPNTKFTINNLNTNKSVLQDKSKKNIEHFLNMYNFSDQNYVKPGIGETTRVFLRRTPKALWLQARNSPEVAHLVYLAEQRQVPIYQDPSLIYKATAIIEISD